MRLSTHIQDTGLPSVVSNVLLPDDRAFSVELVFHVSSFHASSQKHVCAPETLQRWYVGHLQIQLMVSWPPHLVAALWLLRSREEALSRERGH